MLNVLNHLKIKKRQKQVLLNERGNLVPQKESENGDNDNYQKIYAFMEYLSGNNKSSSRNFGDSSKLTNWILDSGSTCHMTPQISYFILGSLEDTDKYIKLVDRITVTEKQKDDNKNPFVTTLHNVLLAPYLCNRLFSIIMYMNLVHTCLFLKGF